MFAGDQHTAELTAAGSSFFNDPDTAIAVQCAGSFIMPPLVVPAIQGDQRDAPLPQQPVQLLRVAPAYS